MISSVTRPGLLLAALLLCISPVRAQDFVRDTIPGKWIEPLLPEQLPDLTYPSYFNDLDKAKAQAFAGRYKLSLLTLSKLKDLKAEDATAAALVKGRALAALGRGEEALAALSQGALKDQPDVQAQRAQVLADLGRTDESLALLKELLAAHGDSVAGHYLLGSLSERVGDLESARAAYAWFTVEQKFLQKWADRTNGPFERAEDVTQIGRALDRWAALNGAYKDNTTLHGTILSFFVKAYDEIDRTYWPAHVAAAEYFMSHDQRKEATEELAAALQSNPNDAGAWRLRGMIALQTFDFDGADSAVAALRRVNAQSADADLLDARNLLLQRRPRDAQSPVQRVLKAQPKNLEALGLLAAVQALQLEDEKTAQVLKQVEQLDPDNASAYVEVAEQLGAMRQYPRAAEKYKVAIERAPWWTSALNGLGLLYTQSGDEDAARQVLEQARKLDPFNLATTNYMRLLDDMAAFAHKETDHFIVIYDAGLDPIIPEYFGDYLESIYAQVCGDFKHAPDVKTMIEVFPTHDAFSVRTTGSPWIGTVGASTGRVIALVSPRSGQATMGTFNWSQVLRHEFTHTVTLSATDNRIQHWLTEGLAVWEEHSPLRWEWVPMLYSAVTKHELFTMDNLTWGFIRPKRPIDRQLAYAQSFWICTYIEEKYGHDAVLKMLEQFRNAGRQEDVFPSVTGRSIPEFTADFQAWAEQQVAKWGYDKETSKKYDQLKTQAEALTKVRQYDQAVPLWEQIAALRPVDALPHQRLAGLYLSKTVNQPLKAIEQLEALHKVELKDNRYAKKIARLYRDLKQYDKAADYALQAVYIDPYDATAHDLLAELYEKTNNGPGLEREKRVIPILRQWIESQKQANELHPREPDAAN